MGAKFLVKISASQKATVQFSIAAFPADNPVLPGDFIATILFALGIDPHAEMRDKLNRPVAACTGKPLTQLFS